LKFLKSEQALADIANFIDGMNQQLGRKADWIVAGGSYPGAMVAWFKSQYPDYAVGSWSSSGVIHPIKDFKMFDYDIYDRTSASGAFCSNTIQRANDIVTEAFKTDAGIKQVADTFDIPVDSLNTKDFWFFFADIFVMQVQYGGRVDFCNNLHEYKDSDD
jgi:hypothetical protein